MPELSGMLLLVVVLALLFDFSNGWHDSANAIATVVSTRVLSPAVAVLMAGVLNVAGAFMSTAVAKMIGVGIVDPTTVTQEVVAAALGGAILWNLCTLLLGLPTSSSHALIGGLVGAATVHGGWATVKFSGLRSVLEAMIISPFFGFLIGFSIMVAISWLFFRAQRNIANRLFSRLQLVSAGFMAFSHGANDAQKAMGIIYAGAGLGRTPDERGGPDMGDHVLRARDGFGNGGGRVADRPHAGHADRQAGAGAWIYGGDRRGGGLAGDGAHRPAGQHDAHHRVIDHGRRGSEAVVGGAVGRDDEDPLRVDLYPAGGGPRRGRALWVAFPHLIEEVGLMGRRQARDRQANDDGARHSATPSSGPLLAESPIKRCLSMIIPASRSRSTSTSPSDRGGDRPPAGRHHSQVVFRFAFAVGMVALTGTSDRTHMQQDLAAIDLAITESDVAALERLR